MKKRKLIYFSVLLLMIAVFFVGLSLRNKFISAPDKVVAGLPGKEVKLVIYGDSRSNFKMHQQIVDQIIKHQPDAVFHVGDLVDDPSSAMEWETVNQTLKPLRDMTPFFVAAGNHEQESQAFYDNFDFPGNEKWYSWDMDNAHVIVLNTNTDISIEAEQYHWAEKDLSAVPKGKTVIVVTHHPLISVGDHASEPLSFKQDLMNLFNKYNIKLVFSGHEHNYERFLYHNVNYIVTGGGGAPLHNQQIDNESLVKFIKSYNFCVVSIGRDKLSVDAFDENDQKIDNIVIDIK